MDGSHTLIHINMLYRVTLQLCPPGNCGLILGQLLLALRGQFCHLFAQSTPHEPYGGCEGWKQGRKSRHLQETKLQLSTSQAVQSSGKNKNPIHPLMHCRVTCTGEDSQLLCCICCLVAAQVRHPSGDRRS